MKWTSHVQQSKIFVICVCFSPPVDRQDIALSPIALSTASDDSKDSKESKASDGSK